MMFVLAIKSSKRASQAAARPADEEDRRPG